MDEQLELFQTGAPAARRNADELHTELSAFQEFGTETLVTETSVDGRAPTSTYVNEFWTSKQRAAHSLHELSYRACFKPQLPRFFIERLTGVGDVVYDPFMGRGTTLLEAALLGRTPIGCDVNPLSQVLVEPRLDPPTFDQTASRLDEIDFADVDDAPEDLLVFYHPDTLAEISALRRYLLRREKDGLSDAIDRWVRMVAINRLTGHSPGFFSVYTLPPNQAVSVKSQRNINARRNQTPPRRDALDLILRKTTSLLRACDDATRRKLAHASRERLLLTTDAASTDTIPSGTVDLVVTSPPFLDVVDYAQDNWLRCWCCGSDVARVQISMHGDISRWQAAMSSVFVELMRVLRPGGHVAFEVGEVRGGKVRLEEIVLPCGMDAGLDPQLVLINEQDFTKTSNCWGVTNRTKGTHTPRVVLFRKS